MTPEHSHTGFNQGDHRGGEDVCLTPPSVIDALGGPVTFDLDPCAAPDPRPWPTAARHVTLPANGLAIPWAGSVWLNPPYSEAAPWVERLSSHGDGVLLVFSRTDADWYQQWVLESRYATGLLFIRGRLGFFGPDGARIRTKKGALSSAGAPSCLVSYDRDAWKFPNLSRLVRALRDNKLRGQLISPQRHPLWTIL